MRTIEAFQVLTTGRVDLNGNCIPPDVIEWEGFDNNPVLLYDKECEGHHGVVVGKVIDRKRVGDGFAGRLSFMDRFLDADIAYEKYTQGVLPFVSIGGFAVGEEKDGVFTAMRYRPREFSLVKFPANVECKTLNQSELGADEQKIVASLQVDGKEVRYLTMSAGVEDMKILNANEMTEPMTEPIVEASTETAVEAPTETAVEAPTETAVEASTETTVEASTEPIVEASTESTVEASTEPIVEASTETTVEASTETTVEASTETTVEASTETTVEASAEGTEGTERITPTPQGMGWHEKNQSQQISQTMNKTFQELNCDAGFQQRLAALNAAYRMGSPTADANPENTATVKELAASMLLDEKMVILANATNVTDGITHVRKNALETLVECAAGGGAAATLAAADLGVIKYLSLVYQKLLANDTFRRSVRFVPMSDRTGAIFIESGINVPTYAGNVTPVNAPKYFYDDVKRTIARKVFTFSPITFQHADMAVLAYDKQSLGIATAMDTTMQDISTYWLQVIANTPNIQIVGTTGASVKTKGLFPLEAPNSDLTVKKPTLDDLIALEGRFLMQNYHLNGKTIELVLPANVYSMIASDPDVRSRLTRELSANIAAEIHFSATRMTPRNPVARFNTTSGKAELDVSMYADNVVADDGTFVAATPAVTTADHIGAGVAFVAEEVIGGIGTIELVVMPDPSNYGTTISGWVSTGATVARQNGVGAAMLVPTKATV